MTYPSDAMPPRGPAVSVRRKRKPSEFHSEVTRERIRAGVIIDRFQKHFMGELDLTATQIRVGEVLLRKVIPDLTHTDPSTWGNTVTHESSGMCPP